MTKPRVVVGTSCVFAAYTDPLTVLSHKDDAELIRALSFASESMRGGEANWIYLGKAEVKITLLDKEQMAFEAIKSLEAEATNLQAETQAKLNHIQEKISKLQALEWGGS